MERIIKVSAFEFAIAQSSLYYVHKYDEYGLKGQVVDSNRGILWDKYVLRLNGSAENIQLFLDYLKSVGFKIY
jgi:hypothetical protein